MPVTARAACDFLFHARAIASEYEIGSYPRFAELFNLRAATHSTAKRPDGRKWNTSNINSMLCQVVSAGYIGNTDAERLVYGEPR